MSIFFFFYTLYKHRGQTKERDNNMARVLISMPEEFLGKIDEVAETENRSRSELIREALRTYIHKQKVNENIYAQKNAQVLEALLG